MPRLRMKGLRGLDLNRPVPDEKGLARILKNMHLESGGRVSLRSGWKRMFSTVETAAIWNAISFRNQAGTMKHVMAGSTKLRSFDPNNPAAARTDLLTGMSGTMLPDFAVGNGFLVVADALVKNYVGDGTTFRELHSVTASAALSPTEAGAVTGFGTGDFLVCYSFYDPTLDMETPPRAFESITKSNANLGIRVTTPASPGNGFTQMRFYRSKVNENRFYFSGTSTSFSSTFDYTVLDASLGSPSFPSSKLHNDDGATVAEKPAAASFCCWHKGRMHLAEFPSFLLRIIWSDVNRPTQYRTANIGQAPEAYHDLLAGAGTRVMGINSFDGSLVCFKDYSITVRNGDIDAGTFQWFVPVDGIGCIAEWSRAVAPGIGIFFMAHDGIYIFTNNAVVNISDPEDGSGIGEYYRSFSQSDASKWFGVWNPRKREYMAFFGAPGSQPSQCFVYSVDQKGWSGPFHYPYNATWGFYRGGIAETNAGPAAMIGVGDASAFIPVLLDEQFQADSGHAGGFTGNVVSVTGDHLNVGETISGYLIGLYVTVRHGVNSYETKPITGTTSSQIQVGSAWSSSPTGKTYYVGAIQGIVSGCRFDAGDDGFKELQRVGGQWTKQTHLAPVRCGWTKNDETQPSYAAHERTMGDVRFSTPATDRCVTFSPFFEFLAANCAFELRSVEVDFDFFETREPSA